MTYRDHLPPHYRAPLAIQRTQKRPGDLVLGNVCRPVERVCTPLAPEVAR